MFECGSQLVIPKSFEECYTYEMQLLWLKNYIVSLEKRIEVLEKAEVLEKTGDSNE